MDERELSRILKPLSSGDEVDLTIRYRLRHKGGVDSTFGFVCGGKTHCLFIDAVLPQVQKIGKVMPIE